MPLITDQFRLDDKVAVVTGAARGLGRAAALALAESGADIVLVDLAGASMANVADEIRTLGKKVMIVECDVTNSEAVDRFVSEMAVAMGGLDIVVNNAGVCVHETAENMSDDQWLGVMNVNLNAVYYVARAAAKVMIARKTGGRMVNIASMSGRIVNRPQAQCAYNASKAGVIQLTRSLACEWAPYHVAVNSVSPGYIATEMTIKISHLHDIWVADTPMKRLASPAEIVPAIIFLTSAAAGFITGHDLVVDGGFSCW